jgi:hypothetical protein
MFPTAQGRLQDLRFLQPPGGGKERLEGDFAAAVLAQGPAREFAAQRGRPLRHQGRHPGRRAMAQDQDLGAGDRLPPGAGADAGFHRRARRGRSRRHAGRHAGARRRCQEDQSAGPRGSRYRSFGRGQFLRQQHRLQEKRRGGVQAKPGALPFPQMGAALVRGFPRGAARHRHLPPGEPRISLAHGLDGEDQGQVRRQGDRHRARLSGHARTPRW